MRPGKARTSTIKSIRPRTLAFGTQNERHIQDLPIRRKSPHCPQPCARFVVAYCPARAAVHIVRAGRFADHPILASRRAKTIQTRCPTSPHGPLPGEKRRRKRCGDRLCRSALPRRLRRCGRSPSKPTLPNVGPVPNLRSLRQLVRPLPRRPQSQAAYPQRKSLARRPQRD